MKEKHKCFRQTKLNELNNSRPTLTKILAKSFRRKINMDFSNVKRNRNNRKGKYVIKYK